MLGYVFGKGGKRCSESAFQSEDLISNYSFNIQKICVTQRDVPKVIEGVCFGFSGMLPGAAGPGKQHVLAHSTIMAGARLSR